MTIPVVAAPAVDYRRQKTGALRWLVLSLVLSLGVGGQAFGQATTPPYGQFFQGNLGGPWTTAGRPTTLVPGLTGYNTTLGTNETWNGSAWVAIGSAGSATIGTSGATLGLLNANKTDSGNNTYSGAINATGANGYQINGLNGLVVTAGAAGLPYDQLVAIGPGACQALRVANTTISNGLFCAGDDSGRFATNGGSENFLAGQFTGYNITTAQFVTAVGDGVVSFDNSNYMVGVGGDTFRDTIGCTGCTGVGPDNQRDGIGSSNTSMGLGALQGNAGSFTFTANPTVGDVWTISFTTTSSGTSGLPASASFTAATTSLTDLTSGLAASIISHLQSTVTGSLPDSTPANTDAQFGLSAFGTGNVLSLHFPGSRSQGWQITGAASCVGTCTSTVTSADAFSGTDNIAQGVDALYAAALTTGSYNHARGDGSLIVLAGTSSGVQCDGYHCGYVALSGTNSVIGGNSAMNAASALTGDVVFGSWTSVTTGTDETLIGEPNGGTQPTTATGDTLVGYGCRVASATAAWSTCFGNVIWTINGNIGGGGSSEGFVGIATMSPGGVLDVLGPDTSTTILERLQNSTPTPMFTVLDNGRTTFGGQVILNSGTPTIASGACGATTNGTIAGSNQSGVITIASATTTACAVLFSAALPAAPASCKFSAANAAAAAVTVLPYISAISASGFTLTGAVLASTTWGFQCI